jgi:hypothetical protein
VTFPESDLAEKFKKSKIVERAELKDPDELISLMEELNSFYRQLSPERLSAEECGIDKEKGEKEDCDPFYLGLFQNYEWIERIIVHKRDHIQYDLMGHYIIKKSPPISSRIRGEVTRKLPVNPKHCFCCDNEIEEPWYCFVVPVCFGGRVEVQNIEMTCYDCYSEVGIMNLNEYRGMVMLRDG